MDALDSLKSFIEQTRPRNKKEIERELLNQLLTEYSAEHVLDALLYVQKQGVLGK